jgi:hypothetical protein
VTRKLAAKLFAEENEEAVFLLGFEHIILWLLDARRSAKELLL